MSEQLRGCSALTRACSRRRVTSLSQRPCRVVRAPVTVLCRRRDPERRSATRRIFRVELADSDHPPDPERRAPSRQQPADNLTGRKESTTEGNSDKLRLIASRSRAGEGNEADQEGTGLLAGFHDARAIRNGTSGCPARTWRITEPSLSWLPSVTSGPFGFNGRKRRDGARRSNVARIRARSRSDINHPHEKGYYEVFPKGFDLAVIRFRCLVFQLRPRPPWPRRPTWPSLCGTRRS